MPLLPMLLSSMQGQAHPPPDAEVRARVLSLSTSTIDRVLSPSRAGARVSRYQHNPPLLAIRRLVRVRTFSG